MGAPLDRGAGCRVQPLGSPRGSAARPPAERQLGPPVDDPLGLGPYPSWASAIRWLVSLPRTRIVALPPLSEPPAQPDCCPRARDRVRSGILGNPLPPPRELARERLLRGEAPRVGTVASGGSGVDLAADRKHPRLRL